MKSLIKFFITQTYSTNFIFITVLLLGILSWVKIPKEEMPNFESSYFNISVGYPGSSAEDVERLITSPIEREIRGISGVLNINSESGTGTCSISIELDPGFDDLPSTITSIREAAERADIPELAAETLSFRQFKTTEKAILDIGVYDKKFEFLDYLQRAQLEQFTQGLEDKLTSLKEISSVERSGSRTQELQVLVDHTKLEKLSVSLSQVLASISKAHVLEPAGSLEDKHETKVSIVSDWSDPIKLQELVIRTNEMGRLIRLKQLATIKFAYKDPRRIRKLNGHETITLQVKKNSSVDILSAREAILKTMKSLGKNDKYQVVLMDDESYDVRNRIQIISSNGIVGFILILVILFIFLDFKSGVWSASGIPFCLAFTISFAYFYGYTINNITLASIIIVLGIVVDDAIIIAENIARKKQEGMSSLEACYQGTVEMALPIVASIATTCAAFFPLFSLSGGFGKFISYMPLMVFAMLGASLLESLFILPSHLNGKAKARSHDAHWFKSVENLYARSLERLLLKRKYVFVGFTVLLALTCYLFVTQMKYVMFPREEGRQVFIRVNHKKDLDRFEMAKEVGKIEKFILKNNPQEVVAVSTTIGQSRRGNSVTENEAFVKVELVPKEERDISLKLILKNWEDHFATLEDFEEINIIRQRFGHSSGSPLAIEISESSDKRRALIAERIKKDLSSMEGLSNIEVETPLKRQAYQVLPKGDRLMLSEIDASSIAQTVRTYLNGTRAFKFLKHDEEIETVVQLEPKGKSKIEQISNLLVENKLGNLIPIGELIELREEQSPLSIKRKNLKRTTMIYGDFAQGTSLSPLEIADELERGLFVELLQKYPSSQIQFRGEVEETRETKSDLILACLLVVFLIYGILCLLFSSLLTPLIVISIIPFGLIGVILAFYAHGMLQIGFLAIIGTLGMIGVVVNDSIVLISRLLAMRSEEMVSARTIAEVSASRLRAIVVTTLTTVAGIFPTAYGVLGYDSMLAEMMLAMGWGLVFGMVITLVFTPCLYSLKSRKLEPA